MRTVSISESLRLLLNLRQKMEVFIAQPWYGSTNPAWPERSERLTPQRALARLEECLQCEDCRGWCAFKAISRDGAVFDPTTLRNAIAYSKRRARTTRKT